MVRLVLLALCICLGLRAEVLGVWARVAGLGGNYWKLVTVVTWDRATDTVAGPAQVGIVKLPSGVWRWWNAKAEADRLAHGRFVWVPPRLWVPAGGVPPWVVSAKRPATSFAPYMPQGGAESAWLYYGDTDAVWKAWGVQPGVNQEKWLSTSTAALGGYTSRAAIPCFPASWSDGGQTSMVADSDGDGDPNTTDPSPSCGAVLTNDLDGDGLWDDEEAEALLDTDGDGFPDVSDPYPTDLLRYPGDLDGDGTPSPGGTTVETVIVSDSAGVISAIAYNMGEVLAVARSFLACMGLVLGVGSLCFLWWLSNGCRNLRG